MKRKPIPVRKVLEAVLSHNLSPYSPRKVALAFSGGTDSVCLLFSLLKLGFKPRLYTYYLQDTPSDDLYTAEHVAGALGLPLTRCMVPKGLITLWTDVLALADLGITGKVNCQCMHGHIYIARACKEPVIVDGTGADTLYGSFKSVVLAGSRDDKAIFDQHRNKGLKKLVPQTEFQANLYEWDGIDTLFPYFHPAFVKHLMRFSWRKINTPKLKSLIVNDYPEYNDFKKLYRQRGSQQIIAGTREHHEQLKGSFLNVKKRGRVDEIYKDLAALTVQERKNLRRQMDDQIPF